MTLVFEGEVHRINEMAPDGDFPGGASLVLSDELADVKIWVPLEELPRIKGLRRLQRVRAVLMPNEKSFTTAGGGDSRTTRAVKLRLISIAPLDGAAAVKAA